MANRVRLLTYNIRGCLGMDNRRDLARIASVIQDSRADIVCLQEIHKRFPLSGFSNQPGDFARSTGFTVVFQPTIGFQAAGYGIAVATHFPILGVRRHALPSRRETRGLLEVSVRANQRPITIFCAHLGLSVDERLNQVEAIAARVGEIDGPVVLAGDFNEPPDGLAVTKLIAESGLRLAEGTAPTYPADTPAVQIDLVLYTAEIQIIQTETLDVAGSDHLPVVVDWE